MVARSIQVYISPHYVVDVLYVLGVLIWDAVSRFFRDVGMRGWTGGEDGTKVMVFEVDMPHCAEENCTWNRPAIWALNAKVSSAGLFCELS